MKDLAEKRKINWKLKYFVLRGRVILVLGLLIAMVGLVILAMRGII